MYLLKKERTGRIRTLQKHRPNKWMLKVIITKANQMKREIWGSLGWPLSGYLFHMWRKISVLFVLKISCKWLTHPPKRSNFWVSLAKEDGHRQLKVLAHMFPCHLLRLLWRTEGCLMMFPYFFYEASLTTIESFRPILWVVPLLMQPLSYYLILNSLEVTWDCFNGLLANS